MRVAILGSGKIACDLLVKVNKSKRLQCLLMAGRRADSPGLAFARKLGIKTTTNSLISIIEQASQIDLLFDTTSAQAHIKNFKILAEQQFPVINLTPAMMDFMCIPALNLAASRSRSHISLVTCGGQTSIPIIASIVNAIPSIDYVEVVTTIAANSAGLATRQNIDEYQKITESAITKFTAIENVKSILLINPAQPPIVSQSTIYLIAEDIDLVKVTQHIKQMVKRIQSYVPCFELGAEPIIDDGRLVIMLKVYGAGDYLANYAGNLDIITSAACHIAEAKAQVSHKDKTHEYCLVASA